ncbi:MAG: SUMF1/EgtB/PvdO family nonheme iron enzyme, partial [Pseudomonadales bacterium]|nr:SUMF1/EgtB/PvdO family nonheme iron enzyme [Pseudomonadales bacterium]
MTSDCWNVTYEGAPSSGGSWATGDCSRRVVRGGSWKNTPFEIMSANRNWAAIDYRFHSYGFRLAHDGWFKFVKAPQG